MIITLNDRRIVLSEQVKKIMSSYRQIGKNTKEAGGILLGQITPKDIYVYRATIPTNLDKRSAFNFIRSPKSAHIIAEYEFLNSDGLITYIGEWHSHPENDASPSYQDHKMIQEQFYENTLSVENLILVIVGRQTDFIGLYDGHELYQGRGVLTYND